MSIQLGPINGFSKLSKVEKINLLSENYLSSKNGIKTLESFWHDDPEQQRVFDQFSENTITNYFFPYGLCPNVLINDKLYLVPMVIEESSVVAAASKAAKFWLKRGGVKAEIIDTQKEGQVHFLWNGSETLINEIFELNKSKFIEVADLLSENMKKRGGGLIDLRLVNKTSEVKDLYQIHATFNTCDAMGANFINTILEAFGKVLEDLTQDLKEEATIVMAILSNYTPECRVKVSLECDIEQLDTIDSNMSGKEFAVKMKRAVDIANADVYRATTHNKGIFNGVDAVILATGNDFRAVESCGHAYAARDGRYRSLTKCTIDNNKFKFWIELPIAIGTVGGLTALHPMAKISLDMLGRPNAPELMSIAAATGLLQNFAALRSLTTTGIQKGHMKMHLMNILNHLEANDSEREEAVSYFKDRVVSFQAVRDLLQKIRNYQ